MTAQAVRVESSPRRRRFGVTSGVLLVALLMAIPVGAVQADEHTGPPTQPPPRRGPALDPAAPPVSAEEPPTQDATVAAPHAERVEALIAAARAYIGSPYRLGMEGPTLFDCSGLVFRAFADAGELGRIGAARMRAVGYMRWFARRGLLTTAVEDAERGDLVVYSNGEHMGIYLGDGRVLSAVITGVTVHSLDGLNMPVTGFLAVDWSGQRGPFEPGAPVPAFEENEAPATLVPTAAWTPEIPSEELLAGPVIEGEERIDMRTATSRTWETPEGAFVTEFFARPIHYLPVDSTEWQPIDLRFRVPEGDESPEGDEQPLAISDVSPASVALDGGGLVTVTGGDLALSMSPVGRDVRSVGPELAIEGTYADYRDTLGAGAGLRILPRADGFKAFLVFARRPDASRFAFTLDTGALIPTANEDGSVTLVAADGSIAGRFMSPMLFDSSDTSGDGGGVRPGAASIGVVLAPDGPARLTLTLNRAMLDEAVYPAYVDLTLVDFPTAANGAGHTFASSAHPLANFSAYQRPESPYAELWHGRRPGRRDDNEAYLRFAGVHDALAGVTVESASVLVFPYWQRAADEPRTTWVGRVSSEWDPRTLTWETRPAADEPLTQFETSQGTWGAIDATAYASALVNAAADYGLVLHANGAGRDFWKRLVVESTIGDGALEPRLVVSWSSLRPQGAAAAELEDGAVQLAWTHPGVAPDARRLQIQVSADGFQTRAWQRRIKDAAAAGDGLTLAAGTLQPGTYAWRVRAKYGEATTWSRWSDAVSFVVAAPEPAAAETPALPQRTP